MNRKKMRWVTRSLNVWVWRIRYDTIQCNTIRYKTTQWNNQNDAESCCCCSCCLLLLLSLLYIIINGDGDRDVVMMLLFLLLLLLLLLDNERAEETVSVLIRHFCCFYWHIFCACERIRFGWLSLMDLTSITAERTVGQTCARSGTIRSWDWLMVKKKENVESPTVAVTLVRLLHNLWGQEETSSLYGRPLLC